MRAHAPSDGKMAHLYKHSPLDRSLLSQGQWGSQCSAVQRLLTPPRRVPQCANADW